MDMVYPAGGAILLVIWGLSALSRRHPHVGWLQPFAGAFPAPASRRTGDASRRLTALEETRALRESRRRTVYAGAQLLLLGVAIPLGYAALEVMFFSEMTRGELTGVAALSALCIGLGIAAIASASRRR